MWKQQYVNNEKFVDLKWYLRIDKFVMLHSSNPNHKYDQVIGQFYCPLVEIVKQLKNYIILSYSNAMIVVCHIEHNHKLLRHVI